MAHSDINLPHTPTSSMPALAVSDSVITESAADHLVQPALSLEEAAAKIQHSAKAADDRTLRNAIALAALKKRIVNGEAGRDVGWMAWMSQHIELSVPQLYALVHIGEAKDPCRALEEWRRGNNERSKDRGKRNGRRRKAEPLSEPHQQMIKFILSMSPAEVKAEHLRLWKQYPKYH
ncbi:MAG: hypothetical protein H6924_04810 [Alphaproteobacteria bacterium]|nr:hypothetical protein [Alphaproteobacteria bacterium]